MKRLFVSALFVLLLAGCARAAAPATSDPFTVVEGPFRVRLETEPAPLRVGQEATFTVTVEDAASGVAAEAIEVRPVVEMTMPDRMAMALASPQQVGPGRFRTAARLEHSGALRATVNVAREGVVTAVSFPEIQVHP